MMVEGKGVEWDFAATQAPPVSFQVSKDDAVSSLGILSFSRRWRFDVTDHITSL
jgi:hypothetical protein